MANNPFQFQIGQTPVPTGRPTQPLQQPATHGTADIIMEMARQSNEARQSADNMRQKSLLALQDAIQGTLSLMEKRHENMARLAQASAMFEFLQNQIPTVQTYGGKPFVQTNTKSGIKVEQIKEPAQENQNRLLNRQELEAFGVPSGATVKDVAGMMPTSPTTRGTLNQTSAALGVLSKIKDQFEKLDVADTIEGTPFRGGSLKIQALSPATDAGRYAGLTNNIALIVRGLGERGVLTDNDVARAQTLIATFFDTKESGRKRLEDLKDIMTYANFRAKAGLVGSTVGNFQKLSKAGALMEMKKSGISKPFALEKLGEMIDSGEVQ